MIPSKYKTQITVMPSMMDINTNLGVIGTMALFQDITSVHSAMMGVDNPVIAKKSNAYWAIARSKIRFLSHPKIFERMNAVTWPLSPKFIRCDRNYLLCDENDTPLILGRSEWVILDRDTHKIRKVDTTCYPRDMIYSDDDADLPPYSRFKAEFDVENFVYTKTVRSSSIDASNHTNNVRYIEIMLDALPVEFFRDFRINEFDVRYVNESREGDRLDVFAKQTNNSWMLACKKPDGETVAEACAVFSSAQDNHD